MPGVIEKQSEMKHGTKIGGIAALVQAACYVWGFVLLATAMNPGAADGWSRIQRLEFILEREALFQWWNLVIYVVFGVALVVLTAVLHRLLQQRDPLLMSIASSFGVIWAGLVIASGMVASVGLEMISEAYLEDAAAAADSWRVLGTVQDGLGGGVEIVGGIWVLLVSAASLRSGQLFPKPLDWFGLLVGVSGIVTIVPALGSFGAVFGLAQIVWFIAVGVALIRTGDAEQVVVADA